MKNPQFITVHCSATPNTRDIGRDEIDEMHVNRGWRGIGYHFVIRRDGTLENGRDIHTTGAHVRGHNKNNIGICLVGTDEFTDEQFDTLRETITELASVYGIPESNIKGHRDWPGVAKECPCFDVQEKLAEWKE